MEGLGSGELDIARLLALGEPLELETVSRITGLAPLAGLEARGLATVAAPRTPTDRGEARLSHPLYGEVVRAATPRLGAVELRKRLAEAVRANGLSRPGDALRVATWLDEAGAALDESLLLAAARDANASGDPTLAERLALRAGDGPERALVLGRALILERRFAEAEAVLAAWEVEFRSKDDAVVYLEHRALRVLHIGLKRSEVALALLGRAEAWFGDADWRDRVGVIRGQVLLTSPGAGSAEAVDALTVSSGGTTSSRSSAAGRRLRTLSASTRSDASPKRASSRAASTDGRAAARRRRRLRARRVVGGSPHGRLRVGGAGALARGGRPRDRPQRRSPHPRRGLDHARLHGDAEGEAAMARRRAREAIEVLEQSDSMGRLPLAWRCLALSAAMQGDPDGARAALAGYDAAVGDAPVPYLQALEVTARAELALLEGETSRASAMLVDAAAASEGDPLDQATVLHEALRAGVDPRSVVSALAAAARACDAPLVGLFAQLAAAMAAGDGDALTANAKALGEIGASLWAAESAALAALAYERSGAEDSARRAVALSAHFRAECEDVWSPLLAAVELAPAALTQREREIASLSATGVSNAEIAGRLVLSIRTVESHLYRAMRKLGINTRRELEIR